MTSVDAPLSYIACLLPASDIGAISRWVVPYAAGGHQPYLVLTFRIGTDTFHRVWTFARDVGREARYSFLGDTSADFPGTIAPDLGSVAQRALQLVPELRASDPIPPRRPAKPFRAQVRRTALTSMAAAS